MSPGIKLLVCLATLVATAIAGWITNTAAQKPAGIINYAPQPMYGPDGAVLTPTVEGQAAAQKSLPVLFLQMWLTAEFALLFVVAVIAWSTN